MPNDSVLEMARLVDPTVKSEDIAPLNGGFSSQAYKINHPERPFVLLTARPGGVSNTNYGHAFVVLKILESRSYPYAPKPLWLKGDKMAIALEYFKGKTSDAYDFVGQRVDPLRQSFRVIEALLDTHDITRDTYEATARSYNLEPLATETAIDAANIYGKSWFEVVRTSCPDRDIVVWLEPRLERSYGLAQELSKQLPIFSHGDPSNPNILIAEDGTFKLIDWESSRFQTVWAEYLIAYTTNLTDFMKPYRKEVIDHVASRIGISGAELTTKVDTYRKFAEVFDVNWAAMMMAKVVNGTAQGDASHFRDIARERMQRYDALFPLS